MRRRPTVRSARPPHGAGATLRHAAVLLAGLLLAVPSVVGAQEANARTGAVVLAMPAGSRAPALAGAAAAEHGDADALFYNPAGAAGLDAAFSASYQSHVVDITFLSAAGAYRLGAVVVGATVGYLDFGAIDVLVPDPDFGGQVGYADGSTATAAEGTARLLLAAPLLDGRLRVGVAGGFVTTRVAEAARSTAVLDAGVQLSAGPLAAGLSFRNVGNDLSGDGIAETPLPAEARLGAQYRWRHPGGLGAAASADVIRRLNGDETAVAAGLEAGLLPGGAGVGAVARFGWSGASDDLGALRLGAGVSIGAFALDYTHQDFDAFGSVHRFGVRWSRPR